MMRPLLTLLLCCLFPPALLAEAQPATVLQQSSLYAEPFTDAEVLTTLVAKQQVTILQRKGGWYQVRSANHRGWLRMSHVRFGDGSSSPQSSGGLSQTLRFLSTGRSGSDGVTVATGIRGLDAADISNARPDHRAVNKLSRYQARPEQAKQFAQTVLLKSQPLGYFDE